MRLVAFEPSYHGWRAAARALLAEDVPPDDTAWQAGAGAQASLLADRLVAEIAPSRTIAPVPRAFLKLASAVACHRDEAKWDALYRVLWRLTHGEPRLLEVEVDADVHRLRAMERAVRRAVHKMHAFVRFRSLGDARPPGAVPSPDAPLAEYVAWFEPPHPVLERAAPFFTRRFPSMRWSILTPERTAHWDGERLTFGPGVSRELAPRGDALEELWRAYYAHVFNPARLSLDTMRAEMPQRYWRNLPEASLVRALAREAPRRVTAMLAQALGPAQPLPDDLRLREAPMRGRPDPAERPARQAAVRVDARDLAAPGDDAVHDPGILVARDRARAVARRAPGGFQLGDARVRHGTASWTDPSLLVPGAFYPDGVDSPEARLRFYASRFPLVEVDATYYAPPSRETAVRWAERTPAGFVFDVKAYALMTGHGADARRMPDWLRRALPAERRGDARVYAADLPDELLGETWRRFLAALRPLADTGKLGAVLLQYPPWFAPSAESARELRRARERLGATIGAVEFRDPAWVTGRIGARTFALLEELGLAYVSVDAPPGTRSSMPPVMRATSAELAIVRLHGRRTDRWEARNDPVSERYRYLYDRDELRAWARRLADFVDVARLKQGVHVLHNNCHANYGTTNAEEIAELLIEANELRRQMGREARKSGNTNPRTPLATTSE